MDEDTTRRQDGRFRVLVVSPDFPPALGGIQRLVHRVSLAMPGVETRVLTLRTEGWQEFDRRNPQPTSRLPMAPGPPVVRNLAFNMQATLSGLRWRPDAILGGHIVAGPALAALSRVYGVPSVCYLHGKEIWGRPGLTRWTLRNNTAGIVVSEHSREKTAGVLGGVNAPLHVIQPGVEPPDLSGAVKADRPTVVTVARLRDWYKGHDVMLEALREVHRQVPDVRWVVVGEGQLKEEIAERAHRFGLDEVVELTGAVDDETRDALLASAHVFSMPSRYPPDSIGGEGFPLVYLEAAAFGLPVVAGDEGGPREAVVQEETGLLVDPTDAGAVAPALIRLLKNPEEAHRMGMRGRERTQTAFTYDEIGARVGKVLRDYAAGEAGSPTSP